MTPEEHAKRLKIAMLEHDMTAQQVADALGVHQRTVRNWVAGRTLPSLEGQFELRTLLGDYDWPKG